MSGNDFSGDRVSSGDRTILTLSRPFWLLLGISFVCMTALAGLLTFIQNDNALRSSEHLFQTVVADLSDRLSEQVLEYAYWDDAVDHLVGGVDADWVNINIAPYLYDTLDITDVYVIDASGATMLSVVDGKRDAVDPAARFGTAFAALVAQARATRDDAMPVPVAGFLRQGDAYFLAAAARMTTYMTLDGEEVDRSTGHVLVFARALDAAFLQRLSASYLLPQLRIAGGSDGFWTAALPVETFGGIDRAAFLWRPRLPGSDMLPKLLAGLVLVFGLMLAMARAFVRRADAAARTLEDARGEAQRANQAKTEFIRSVAHELRTPANAIIGFAGIMQQEMFGPLGSRKYAEYADDIAGAGDHMLCLVNDLLDLDRIEAGEAEFVAEPLDANRAVQDAASYVSDLAAGKGIEVALDLAERVPAVETDPRALRQILLNLLSNAVKFTPAGGQVVCRTFTDGSGGLAMQVSDSGPGLTAEQVEKVLQPFGQVASGESTKYRGTGLGLPISQRLTEALGGRFVFDSRVGAGTTVTVVLPASG